MTTGETGSDQAGTAVALTAAEAILAIHVADECGFCRYCLIERGHLVDDPCTQARWAIQMASGGDGRQ